MHNTYMRIKKNQAYRRTETRRIIIESIMEEDWSIKKK